MPSKAKKSKSKLCVSDRMEWRSWLKKNHATATEIWLVYYRKHCGMPTIAYSESVAEALCFGWVDGLKKRLDEQRYCHRFSPRKAASKWSPTNIELARSMIAEGKMTPAGLVAFNNRVNYEKEFLEAKGKKEPIEVFELVGLT